MSTERAPIEADEHAIQLEFVGVKGITFRAPQLPRTIPRENISAPQFTLGRGDYDPEAKRIQVFCRTEFKMLAESKDFEFSVELVGQFKIDESQFPPEKVHDWADRAALYIIFPYMREQIYSLSIRAGFDPPFVLPLIQLPVALRGERPSPKAPELTPA